MAKKYTYRGIRLELDEAGENYKDVCNAEDRMRRYEATVHGQVPVEYNAITGGCPTSQKSLAYALALRKILKRTFWAVAFPVWARALNACIRELRKVPVELD